MLCWVWWFRRRSSLNSKKFGNRLGSKAFEEEKIGCSSFLALVHGCFFQCVQQRLYSELGEFAFFGFSQKWKAFVGVVYDVEVFPFEFDVG